MDLTTKIRGHLHARTEAWRMGEIVIPAEIISASVGVKALRTSAQAQTDNEKES